MKMQELNDSYEVLKSRTTSDNTENELPKGLAKIVAQLQKMWAQISDDEKNNFETMWKSYAASGEFVKDIISMLPSGYLSLVHLAILGAVANVIFSVIGIVTTIVFSIRMFFYFVRCFLWCLRGFFALIYCMIFGSTSSEKDKSDGAFADSHNHLSCCTIFFRLVLVLLVTISILIFQWLMSYFIFKDNSCQMIYYFSLSGPWIHFK